METRVWFLQSQAAGQLSSAIITYTCGVPIILYLYLCNWQYLNPQGSRPLYTLVACTQQYSE